MWMGEQQQLKRLRQEKENFSNNTKKGKECFLLSFAFFAFFGGK